MDSEASRDWIQFSITVDADSVAAAENALIDAGAVSVSLGEGGDDEIFEPGPGEIPLWQRVCVTGLFSATTSAETVRQHLDLAAGIGGWRLQLLPDRAWEREWLRHFRPVRFGDRLLVWPGEPSADTPADITVLRLDPGLAFGTGTHPTTALCLEWLASRPQNPELLVDYGCGSGILAVAGLLLGAGHAIAVDIDPQALTACRDNAARNDISCERLYTCLPNEFKPNGGAELVLANILAAPLIRLAGLLRSCLAVNGHLVLSGILATQADAVRAAYLDTKSGTGRLASQDSTERDGWMRLVLKRLE